MGLIFGHKFEARYSVEQSEGIWPFTEGALGSDILMTNPDNVNMVMEKTRSNKQTYIKDVCARCGETLEGKK